MNLAVLSPEGAQVQVTAINDRSAVTGAIQLASARSGIDFSYLYAQAKLESGLNPNARASTSSARGLYQFTAATWLDMVRKHGAANGLGSAAAALREGASPSQKSAILDLRRDPQAAASMAAAFASDNRVQLEAGLGRPATATDLYIAHFLGASGALNFLRAHAADPQAAGADIAVAAAHANHAVFYNGNGAPRTLAAIYDGFAAKLSGTAVPPTGKPLPVQWAANLPSSGDAAPTSAWLPQVISGATPQTARLAYLTLAGLAV